MKLRKIMAGIIATSVAGTMAVAASAQYDAFLMYADADWYPQAMDATENDALSQNAYLHMAQTVQSQSGQQALQKLLRTVHTQYLSLTSRLPLLMKKQAKKQWLLHWPKAL